MSDFKLYKKAETDTMNMFYDRIIVPYLNEIGKDIEWYKLMLTAEGNCVNHSCTKLVNIGQIVTKLALEFDYNNNCVKPVDYDERF
jgi:hypothetical protein|tara:strand:+ start:40 stop:297 length:258 start_codon:yes stop_codon:yes gene_type:complete